MAQTEGHDGPGCGFELVPSVAAVIDDGGVAVEDAIGEPVVTHELPDVFLGVQLGAFCRQWHDGEVARHDELPRKMPSGLIEQQRGMLAGCDLGCDGGEVQVHGGGVAPWQDQPARLAFGRADGTEEISGGGALVMRRRGTRAAACPAAGDLVLLTDPGLIAEPDLYVAEGDAALLRDRRQQGGEVFLKASTAPSL